MHQKGEELRQGLTVAEKPVIARVQDPSIFPVLATLFDRIDAGKAELPYNKEQFLDYVLEQLHQDTFGLWIAVLPDTGEVVGFAVTTLWQGDLSNEVRARIEVAYMAPKMHKTDAVQRAFERMEEWARQHGATRLFIETRRGVKAFQRKFGFAVNTYRLSKELTNGKH